MRRHATVHATDGASVAIHGGAVTGHMLPWSGGALGLSGRTISPLGRGP